VLEVVLKNVALSCLLVIGLSFASMPMVQAQDRTKENLCSGANLSLEGEGSDASCQPQESEDSLNSLVANIVNILSLIVGIVAVIMIIIGGFKYITANGDSGSISSAKNTIIYAIIGLVIVALAQVIVKFVLSKL
jgi:hypothetical protein